MPSPDHELRSPDMPPQPAAPADERTFHPFLIPVAIMCAVLFGMFLWGVVTGTSIDAVGYTLGGVWGAALLFTLFLLRRKRAAR